MATATKSTVIETIAARIEIWNSPEWGVSARIVVDIDGEERRIRAAGFKNPADEAVAYLCIGENNFSLKKFAAARAARLAPRVDTPAAAAPATKGKKPAADLLSQV